MCSCEHCQLLFVKGQLQALKYLNITLTTEDVFHLLKVIIFRRKTFVELLPDCLLSDLRRQRKERSAIVGTLVEIVTENKKKVSNFNSFAQINNTLDGWVTGG